MTSPERWEPDAQMVAAVLSMPKSSRAMTELSDLDRCWLVAGLTLGGMTAEEIAARTKCSRRLVMSIRAEGVTQDFKVAELVAHALGDELRAERGRRAVMRQELSASDATIARLRTQVDQLLDALKAGSPVRMCSNNRHPMLEYNTYRHGGKERCRECRREWQANRKTALTSAKVPAELEYSA
ncbi:hypothetical protein JVX93_15975 [Mycolicibacterium boenickei]|nr:hypothetical protein JVX93_15975 [Mycolicibacterium boenickei]